ncbi:MAG: hypothetical protein QM804_09250 [Propionicimonas sp.]
MPELNEPPEFTDALREHFAREVDRVGFEPITGAEIRWAATEPAPRRRRLTWLAVAAALVVLVPGGFIAARLLSSPVPAVPAPTEVVPATPGVPTATTPPVASWFPRLTAPIALDGYAQASLDDAVYLVAALPEDGACRLQGYRYQPAVDTWQALPPGPTYPGKECATPRTFARGNGVDVVIAGERARLYRYSAGSSAWKTLPAPPDQACDPVGLTTGVFCLTGESGLEYQVYDAAAGRWREGEFYLGAGDPPEAVTVRRAEVAGREAVWLVAERGGEVLAGSWDPVSGTVSRVNPHPGLGQRVTDVQITADGFAVLTADDPAADTALVLELASGNWRTVAVPLPGGRIFRDQPSDAGWVRLVFPEAADLAVVNGYLYRPVDGSWSAAEPLPLPEPGSEVHGWVGTTGVCRRQPPFNCWGLSVGSLAEVLSAVDPAAIVASNEQVR